MKKIGQVVKVRKPVLGLYGAVKIERYYCPECKVKTFVIDGKMACCGEILKVKAEKTKRMSLALAKRKLPPLKIRQEMLEIFNYSCAYCDRRFGTSVVLAGKERKIVLNWDHVVPYSYIKDNREINYLPSCRVCNKFKGCIIFKSIEEVIVFVQAKWEEKEKHYFDKLRQVELRKENSSVSSISQILL